MEILKPKQLLPKSPLQKRKILKSEQLLPKNGAFEKKIGSKNFAPLFFKNRFQGSSALTLRFWGAPWLLFFKCYGGAKSRDGSLLAIPPQNKNLKHPTIPKP